VGGEEAMMAMASEAYHPSSPLRAIRQRAGGADVRFCNGRYPAEAAQLAAQVDLVVLVATQWMTEGWDAPDLSLPSGQDALIAAVSAANPNTVVVLETGGPVLMPWLDQVKAVLALWYPGSGGGEALAAVLFGDVNPSGRLPITFPRSLDQLPRPELPGVGKRWKSPLGGTVDIATAEGFDVPHVEGSEVGYRWFARRGERALFPFGAGLSYTRFDYSGLEVEGGDTVRVSFDVTNEGAREGIETAQVYLAARNGVAGVRLLGWAKASLAPGETRRLTVEADPRLLADFDVAAGGWWIAGGAVEVAVGASAEDFRLRGSAEVRARRLPP
jgi:beta-glucosidase